MDMETHSDNIIKEKIATITALPENYTPNLNSKWELLQAGLPKQKKPLVLYINNISAIAAILLLIAGLAIQYFTAVNQPIAKPALISFAKEQEVPKLAPTLLVQEQKNKLKKIKTKAIQKTKEVSGVAQLIEIPIVNTDSINLAPVQTPIALVPLSKKNKRFTEIDFDAPNYQAPANNNVAANTPSFKLGFFSNLSATNTTTQKQSTLLLKHNF
jgi:hypothetical protein